MSLSFPQISPFFLLDRLQGIRHACDQVQRTAEKFFTILPQYHTLATSFVEVAGLGREGFTEFRCFSKRAGRADRWLQVGNSKSQELDLEGFGLTKINQVLGGRDR
jgi:hypothetical protein